MNEVISSILTAEKKSEEIIKKAQADARSLKISSDRQAEEIKQKAVEDFKAYRAKELEKAEEDALSQYNKIVKAGEEKASAMIDQAKVNLVKVADKIVEGIIR